MYGVSVIELSITNQTPQHTLYCSITDELETLCGLLSPPRSPRLLSPPRIGESSSSRCRHHSEMSNPEMALYLEKEHLKVNVLGNWEST